MTINYRILKQTIICIIIILYNFAFLSSANAYSKKARALYVFHPRLNELNNAFTVLLTTELKKQIFSHNIKLIDTSQHTPVQLESLMSNSEHCAVTVGQTALKTVLATRSKVPIFSTLVSQTELDRLIESYHRLGTSLSGIYQEQSFKRQLLLSKAIDSKIENIAIVLGRETRYALARYKKEAETESMNLVFNILKYQASPQQYLSRLSLDNVFLLILNDQEHYSEYDLQSLLVTSYQKGIAIIGGKKSDSETAAIASIYTPHLQLAKETAKELKNICSGKLNPKPRFSKHYKVLVNQQTAEYLNYENLVESQLEEKISQLENDQSEVTKL